MVFQAIISILKLFLEMAKVELILNQYIPVEIEKLPSVGPG